PGSLERRSVAARRSRGARALVRRMRARAGGLARGVGRRALAPQGVELAGALAADPPAPRRGVADRVRPRGRDPLLDALPPGGGDRRAVRDRDGGAAGLPQRGRPRAPGEPLGDDEGPAPRGAGRRRGRERGEDVPRVDREPLAPRPAAARRRDVFRPDELPGEARRARLRDRGAEVLDRAEPLQHPPAARASRHVQGEAADAAEPDERGQVMIRASLRGARTPAIAAAALSLAAAAFARSNESNADYQRKFEKTVAMKPG